MASIPIVDLKEKFSSGKYPTGSDFENLIDTSIDLTNQEGILPSDQVESNELNKTLNTKLDDIDDSLSENDTDISDIEDRVIINEEDIDNNSTAITTNATNIIDNSGAISDNRDDIDELQDSIGQPDGIATLDSNGYVIGSQLISSNVQYDDPTGLQTNVKSALDDLYSKSENTGSSIGSTDLLLVEESKSLILNSTNDILYEYSANILNGIVRLFDNINHEIIDPNKYILTFFSDSKKINIYYNGHSFNDFKILIFNTTSIIDYQEYTSGLTTINHNFHSDNLYIIGITSQYFFEYLEIEYVDLDNININFTKDYDDQSGNPGKLKLLFIDLNSIITKNIESEYIKKSDIKSPEITLGKGIFNIDRVDDQINLLRYSGDNIFSDSISFDCISSIQIDNNIYLKPNGVHFYQYDINLKEIIKLSNCPIDVIDRNQSSYIAYLDNYIYIIDDTSSNNFARYDIINNIWESMDAPDISGQNNIFNYDNNLYLFRHDPNNSGTSKIYKFIDDYFVEIYDFSGIFGSLNTIMSLEVIHNNLRIIYNASGDSKFRYIDMKNGNYSSEKDIITGFFRIISNGSILKVDDTTNNIIKLFNINDDDTVTLIDQKSTNTTNIHSGQYKFNDSLYYIFSDNNKLRLGQLKNDTYLGYIDYLQEEIIIEERTSQGILKNETLYESLLNHTEIELYNGILVWSDGSNVHIGEYILNVNAGKGHRKLIKIKDINYFIFTDSSTGEIKIRYSTDNYVSDILVISSGDQLCDPKYISNSDEYIYYFNLTLQDKYKFNINDNSNILDSWQDGYYSNCVNIMNKEYVIRNNGTENELYNITDSLIIPLSVSTNNKSFYTLSNINNKVTIEWKDTNTYNISSYIDGQWTDQYLIDNNVINPIIGSEIITGDYYRNISRNDICLVYDRNGIFYISISNPLSIYVQHDLFDDFIIPIIKRGNDIFYPRYNRIDNRTSLIYIDELFDSTIYPLFYEVIIGSINNNNIKKMDDDSTGIEINTSNNRYLLKINDSGTLITEKLT